MDDCLFCKIVAGAIPSAKVYEDELVYAFNDIKPMAPVHVLIVPKEHVMSSLNDITEENSAVTAHALVVAARIAKQLGLDNGYRIVVNCGDDAGQTVHHLHFHLLGGHQLALELA